MLVVDQLKIAAHPFVAAVLLPESVFVGEVSGLEQVEKSAAGLLAVVRVHPARPEVRIVENLFGLVSDEVANVLADVGSPVIAIRFEAENHFSRRVEQMSEAALGREQGVFGRRPGLD